MSSPDLSDDLFEAEEPWDPYADSSQQSTHTNQVKLCPLLDWHSERTYNESYMRYSVEWKVTVNNRAIMPKDTEQDVILVLAAFWSHLLEPKLKSFLRKKKRPLKSEDTNVVVSVTERSERDLTKRFDDTTIDWAIIEKQLLAWSEWYQAGKKLRVSLSFNYVDTSQSSTTSLGRVDKRGSTSTTRQMLAEGAA
ncbi:hypothetical protein B0O99DRAFT_373214 [Bisporella sp. PMI_857]|nr:hypothetical protein B0O99DRAFT_373214 [Bisporella sp. PMI_857]